MQSPAPPSTPSAHEPHSLRILVVEDEPGVLAVMLEMIALLGHWATGVSSAEGARDRFLEGAFDVLLTDVALPGLSGFDLADMLRARHPVKVIFASGGAPPAIPPGDAVWLQKPFGIDALEKAFAEVQAV
jgi:CheY-like chemotaxis protein